MARAALEAIALQNAELIEVLREESGLAIDQLLADGGAARNDLLLQLQADFAGARVRRPASVEATARGAAALAGLGAGFWDDPGRPDAGDTSVSFEPRIDDAEREARLAVWRDAVGRVLTR